MWSHGFVTFLLVVVYSSYLQCADESVECGNFEASRKRRVKGLECVSKDVSVLLIYSVGDAYSIYLRNETKNPNKAFSFHLALSVKNLLVVY